MLSRFIQVFQHCFLLHCTQPVLAWALAAHCLWLLAFSACKDKGCPALPALLKCPARVCVRARLECGREEGEGTEESGYLPGNPPRSPCALSRQPTFQSQLTHPSTSVSLWKVRFRLARTCPSAHWLIFAHRAADRRPICLQLCCAAAGAHMLRTLPAQRCALLRRGKWSMAPQQCCLVAQEVQGRTGKRGSKPHPFCERVTPAWTQGPPLHHAARGRGCASPASWC